MPHPQMLIAIPFFEVGGTFPKHTAYMPYNNHYKGSNGNVHYCPTKYENGTSVVRHHYAKFLITMGLKHWKHYIGVRQNQEYKGGSAWLGYLMTTIMHGVPKTVSLKERTGPYLTYKYLAEK